MKKRVFILSIFLNFSILAHSAEQNAHHTAEKEPVAEGKKFPPREEHREVLQFENKVQRQIAELRQALERKNIKTAEFASEKLIKMGKTAIKPVSEALKTAEDPAMSLIMMGVLAEIGGEQVVKPIIGMLRDRHKNVSSLAAILLKRMARPPNLIDSLIKELAHEESGTGAANVLTSIGKPAVESLIRALKDKNESVRSFAVLSLGEIGDERAIGPLNEALKDQDVSHYARLALKNFGLRVNEWKN